jgi:hypothetical protein
MNLQRVSVMAAVLAVSLVAAPAHARPYSEGCDDGADGYEAKKGRTINGLECQVDWTDRYRDTWGHTDLGQLCNWDNEDDLFVHCPLLRTEVSHTDGLGCASATMIHQNGSQAPGTPCTSLYGTSTNSSTEFECVLRSAEESGWFGWWYGWGTNGQPNIPLISMGGPGKVWQTEWRAHISLSEITNNEYHKGGTYMISCMLPALNKCGGEVCISSLKWFEK